MNSYILVKDLKKLFKNNKQSIFKMTILLAIMIIGLIFILSLLQNSNNSESDIDSSENLADENNQSPAIFRIYVEHEDGTIYINSMLIEEYFVRPNIVQEAERVTNVEISDVLAEERESNFEKTAEDRGVLGVARNTSNHIFTFVTNIGTAEDNLSVAKFYFDYLSELEVLDNKLVYIVSEPEIFDSDIHSDTGIEVLEDVESDNVVVTGLKLIITVVLSLIIAFFLSYLYFVIQSFFSKTINYSFNYKVSDNDEVYLIEDENSSIISRHIANSSQYPIVILSEDNFKIFDQQNKFKVNDNQLVISSTLDTIDPNISLNNIFIIIDTFNTSKSWYKKTFNTLLSYNNTSIKIFQIN